MKVIKRDGKVVNFDLSKIVNAITKANNEVEEAERLDPKAIKDIAVSISQVKRQRLLVEDIQDMVEEKIMALGKYVLAKTYILYRYKRALVRKANSTDDAILSLLHLDNKELMEENSNKNAILVSTQRDLIAGEVSKDLAQRVIFPRELIEAHKAGILHIHDLDYAIQPMFNCCLINIGDMLDNGTVMNGKMIESPKSFQVACTIMTQIIAAVASSQYGGQSVDIKHLGKYLKKSYDKFYKEIKESTEYSLSEDTLIQLVNARLKEELKAGVQTIQYQINTLMTTNGRDLPL